MGRRVMLLNGRRLDHLDLIILAIRDVTDQWERDHRQRASMMELQHRVKNILNNVRSLASQTRRFSPDLDHFFEAFTPRLAALSRAQDLLLKSSDDDVDLSDIVQAELEAVGAGHGFTSSVGGPALRLSPRDAQAMTMAVHELATNAGKYGALQAEGGRITVAWRIEHDGGDKLHFHWREHGVRIADTEPSRGLGFDIIERSVPYMLGGTSRLDLHSDGAECRIVFPVPGKGQ
jgi:two-component sensor histidine kinase